MGLCLPPAGTDFRRGEPPETSPKGSFLNHYMRGVFKFPQSGERLWKNNLRI